MTGFWLRSHPVLSHAILASGSLLSVKAAGGFTSGWSAGLPAEPPLEQVQNMGLGRHARLQSQFNGAQHGLPDMVLHQGQDIIQFAVPARSSPAANGRVRAFPPKGAFPARRRVMELRVKDLWLVIAVIRAFTSRFLPGSTLSTAVLVRRRPSGSNRWRLDGQSSDPWRPGLTVMDAAARDAF